MQRSVVIDIGSKYLQGGFSGEVQPRFRIEHQLSSRLNRVYLCELLQAVFVKHLLTKPKLHSVVIIEDMMTPRELRNLLVSVLLRDLQVPSVTMQPNLVMGMLSSGCSSAIVLNIGHSSSQAMCFVNNRPLIHTWKESVVGVSHALEDFFQHMLNNNIVSDRATAEKMFYDEARASLNDSMEIAPMEDDTHIRTGQGLICESDGILHVPTSDLSRCLQCLFTGNMLNGECIDELGGVTGLLLECLRACNHDVRLNAASHVVIIGDGAQIPGLTNVLCATATSAVNSSPLYINSLQSVVNKLPEGRIQIVPSAFSRSHLAWVGGSLFSSLKESKAAFVSLADLSSQQTHPSADNQLLTAASVPLAEVGQVASGVLPLGYELKAPDWQSLDKSEWVFCRISSTTSTQ